MPQLTYVIGAVYVDVREFWGDDGDLKPGKKGIMLGKDQVRSTAAHTPKHSTF